MRCEGEKFLQEQMPNRKVAVIGDIMLDKYITGDVNRISPEAPVPVSIVTRQRAVLGGAANTAANLAALGCQVFIAGLIGMDENGATIKNLLAEVGIDSVGLMTLSDYKTTTKVRILGAKQQMLRLDFEEKYQISGEIEKQVDKWIERLKENHIDSIVISDYGKGLITESLSQRIIQAANEKGIPVLVDPKGTMWEKYDSAYAITPNLKELSDCVGSIVANEDEAITTAGLEVLKKYHLKNVVVTRSEKGLTSIQRDSVIHCPAKVQDVFDVSGAGDTVMAILATMAGTDLSMKTVLTIANVAAGISVSHVGTYSVPREAVIEKWKKETHKKSFKSAPISVKELKNKIKEWQSKGETVVFTNGCFDILHRGHVTYLIQAASLGKHLIVGLNTDSSVRRLKGEHRPINNELDRAFMVSSLRCVDEVVLFDEDTPAQLLSELCPDILVKGGDYKKEDVIGREYAKDVKILPFVKGYSTTGIISHIQKGTN